MPDKLTAEQEAAVDDLAKVFDGNPRKGLSQTTTTTTRIEDVKPFAIPIDHRR